jgi:hypothetical protein
MDQEVQRQVQQMLDQRGLVELDKIMDMWRGALEAIRAHVTDGALLDAILQDVLKCIPRPTRAVPACRRPATNNGTVDGGSTDGRLTDD